MKSLLKLKDAGNTRLNCRHSKTYDRNQSIIENGIVSIIPILLQGPVKNKNTKITQCFKTSLGKDNTAGTTRVQMINITHPLSRISLERNKTIKEIFSFDLTSITT